MDSRCTLLLLKSHNGQLLSLEEQYAVLSNLRGIECLMNYHDCCQGEDAAMGPVFGHGHGDRSKELLTLGRELIAADPEIWFDNDKKSFRLRYGEKL